MTRLAALACRLFGHVHTRWRRCACCGAELGERCERDRWARPPRAVLAIIAVMWLANLIAALAVLEETRDPLALVLILALCWIAVTCVRIE